MAVNSTPERSFSDLLRSSRTADAMTGADDQQDAAFASSPVGLF
jgi:hypothetical protein